MLLVPLPWSKGIKALPVLTLLAPSQRASTTLGRRHKRLTDWARQGMLQIIRWLPGRRVVFVGDSSFAVHELVHGLSDRATLISRLRLDANLFALPPERHAHTMGRPAQKGQSLPKLNSRINDPGAEWRSLHVSRRYGGVRDKHLEILSDTALWYRTGTPPRLIRWVLVRDPEGRRAPQAFFSTDIEMEPTDIIACFVRRWQVEVTFAELRAHLGVETQRQWSDKAIARTTPALFGLYSLIGLWACDLFDERSLPYAAAWYRKNNLTFSDAIGVVRHTLWTGDIYRRSPQNPKPPEIPPDRFKRMAEALCFAA